MLRFNPVLPQCVGRIRDLDDEFLNFLWGLHREFTPWWKEILLNRRQGFKAANRNYPPEHLRDLRSGNGFVLDDHFELPDWCQDQRNQMTGPASDIKLCVEMIRSGAPGVMLDLEDSEMYEWDTNLRAHDHAIAAMYGNLAYDHPTRGTVQVEWTNPATVVFLRTRSLGLALFGIFPGPMPAALFDTAYFCFRVDRDRLRHDPAIYIPKTEGSGEGLWWSALFKRIAQARGWAPDTIKAMALVESHRLAHEMGPFMRNLGPHLLGLNLGRWDYMASLAKYLLVNPDWVLPDRNTIPHDVAFYQALRRLLVDFCHRNGRLAIGGMTALYPNRLDLELNARALDLLGKDKQNESKALMDGAWTGHPDQNEIATAAFPEPNQIAAYHGWIWNLDLRPLPVGPSMVTTLKGSRDAARATIRYTSGLLGGRAAVMLDGYMEDRATNLICAIALAQRTFHHVVVPDDNGTLVRHTPTVLTQIFDEALEEILGQMHLPDLAASTPARLQTARQICEAIVLNRAFDPA
jgi:malate synthase